MFSNLQTDWSRGVFEGKGIHPHIKKKLGGPPLVKLRYAVFDRKGFRYHAVQNPAVQNTRSMLLANPSMGIAPYLGWQQCCIF